MKRINELLAGEKDRKRELENINEIYPTKGRSDHIGDIYLDLVAYLRKIHPTIPIAHEVRDLTGYNPLGGSIVDDYKNIVHLQMLHRIPGIQVITGYATGLIDDIFKKHGLSEPSLKMTTKIWSDIDAIITTRLGPIEKSSKRSR